jgi:hypothetical protein
MVERQHAPAHLPWFVTEPGQTDWLMIFMGVFLLAFTVGALRLMLWLLRLPATLVAPEQKAQYEVVSALCLLAMFAPGNFLWIAALLIAMMDFPDPTVVFNRIANAMRRIGENRAVRKTKTEIGSRADLSAPCTRERSRQSEAAS